MCKSLQNNDQKGAALLIMMVILVLAALGYISSLLLPVLLLKHTKEQGAAIGSAEALKLAKTFLLDYGENGHLYDVTVADPTKRPGQLPCPDINQDGLEDKTFDVCNDFIGWLPWATLGLHEDEARDSDGEVLWYLLAEDFSSGSDKINSDTSTGGMVDDVVAVIFSPRAPAEGLSQERRAADSSDHYPMYLEYIEEVATGFIFPPTVIPDSYNDGWLTIGKEELIPKVEELVIAEALGCMEAYATHPDNIEGKFPWPANITVGGNAGSCDLTYGASTAVLGRIPWSLVNIDQAGSCGVSQDTMPTAWPSECDIITGWTDWSELLFLQVATAWVPGGSAALCDSINCLTIDSDTGALYKAMIILSRAEYDGTQDHSVVSGVLENYLEGENADLDNDFSEAGLTNDFLGPL